MAGEHPAADPLVLLDPEQMSADPQSRPAGACARTSVPCRYPNWPTPGRSTPTRSPWKCPCRPRREPLSTGPDPEPRRGSSAHAGAAPPAVGKATALFPGQATLRYLTTAASHLRPPTHTNWASTKLEALHGTRVSNR